MANSTEVKIKAAFVGLLNQTSFEQVTISDITRAAHINRGTFYLHYVDKYALLTSYEDDLASQLDQLLHELADSLTLESLRTNGIYSLNTVASIIEFVANEFGLIQVLFGPNGDPKFEPRLRRIVKDAISTAVYHIKARAS
ncbi:TetR/AcrR family transcriptional regulator [Lacticaseibacillus nasuensis]|uniref:TetR/AcrR family transcriptional regulator n=1 Tax=Lacticaseibacillus nasuensis TaxID=944671 RepID=UPI0006CF22EE|nr:TetR family transcriptional regulator [Lacticaseibacillus nasuensis]